MLRRETFPFGDDLWPTLEPVWTSVAKRDSSAFLSRSWMKLWLEAFGPTVRPTGLIWRDEDGSPVGCALLSAGSTRLGPFPITRVYLNASGASAGCEHNDVLVVPDHREAVLDDLVRMVADLGVDEFALVGVREELCVQLRQRWPSREWEGYLSEAPYVSLGRLRNEGAPYLSALSANTRAQIRRSVRLYRERFGESEVRGPRDGDEAVAWFDRMVALHEERWRSRGVPGAFASPGARAFHRSALAATASDDAVVEILRIRFGSAVIGYLYHLRYRGRVSFYQSGLTYHDDNRLKPGLVAHALAIEHYLGLGEDEYDFLGGEPEGVRYKRSLSTDRRMLAWMQLPSPGPKMRILGALRRAGRRLRSLRLGS